MSLPAFWPAPLQRVPAPFSHPDWLFEIKWDGFRALTYIEEGHCRLLSRNRNEFKSFPALNLVLPDEFHGRSAVLDGEIVCLDGDGKPNFRDLLFRRGEPRFIAFDILLE
jgi:bifunctional non-homologous end joining protein LigD